MSIGGGPQFPILDEAPTEPTADTLQPLGPTMAYRPAEPVADDAWWFEDDDTPHAGRTVQAP